MQNTIEILKAHIRELKAENRALSYQLEEQGHDLRRLKDAISTGIKQFEAIREGNVEDYRQYAKMERADYEKTRECWAEHTAIRYEAFSDVYASEVKGMLYEEIIDRVKDYVEL